MIFKSKYQYYYRADRCEAHKSSDINCICWHDEGTGPFKDSLHDEKYGMLAWRIKPVHQWLSIGFLIKKHFQYQNYRHGLWFRLFGRGLSIIDRTKIPAPFSIRNGYRKFIKIKNYTITVI